MFICFYINFLERKFSFNNFPWQRRTSERPTDRLNGQTTYQSMNEQNHHQCAIAVAHYMCACVCVYARARTLWNEQNEVIIKSFELNGLVNEFSWRTEALKSALWFNHKYWKSRAVSAAQSGAAKCCFRAPTNQPTNRSTTGLLFNANLMT